MTSPLPSKTAPVPPGSIHPASIAFDIDGVIADTMTLFLDIARDEFEITGIRYEDIRSYNLADCIDMDHGVIDSIITRILEGGYRPTLKPIPGSATVLRRLVRHSTPVLLVTARPWVGPVGEFLNGILPNHNGAVDIIATGSFEAKTDVLLQRNISHFVEDRLETCFVLNEAGITPLLYAQPWNRQPHPFAEVFSWGEIEKLIRW